MNLFERIKEERERLGHSQTEFAAVADASKHSQINWEKGETAPNATVLAAWAKIGVDVMYIVTGIRADAHTHLAMKQRSLEMAAETEESYEGIKRRGAVYEAAMKAALSKEEFDLMENWRHCEKEDQAAISRIASGLAAGQLKRAKQRS